jgi:hypothetical protein
VLLHRWSGTALGAHNACPSRSIYAGETA